MSVDQEQLRHTLWARCAQVEQQLTIHTHLSIREKTRDVGNGDRCVDEVFVHKSFRVSIVHDETSTSEGVAPLRVTNVNTSNEFNTRWLHMMGKTNQHLPNGIILSFIHFQCI